MRILILEDEKRNAQWLERLLKEIDPSYTVEGPLASVETTMKYLSDNPTPDLILADIRLTDGVSFDALRQSGTAAPVIFTTAYDEYALKAFKYNSIDYLLKPIDIDELRAAIEKIQQHGVIASRSSDVQKSQRSDAQMPQRRDDFQALLSALQKNSYKYRERFLIPTYDGYRAVPVNDINHIILNERTLCICLTDGTSLPFSSTLDELECQLNPDLFFRVNRQSLIHINSIQTVSNHINGRLVLRLEGYPKVQIVVPRDRVQALKAWLDK